MVHRRWRRWCVGQPKPLAKSLRRGPLPRRHTSFSSPPSPFPPSPLLTFRPPAAFHVGWTAYRNFEYRLFSGDKVSFSRALQGCRAEDAVLASIVTPEEQSFLQEWLFASAFVYQAWIGGTVTSDGDAALTWIDDRRTDLLEPQWLENEADFDGQSGPCVLFQISDPIDDTVVGGWLMRSCRAAREYGMYAVATALMLVEKTFSGTAASSAGAMSDFV